MRRVLPFIIFALLLTSCRLFPAPSPAPQADFTRVSLSDLPGPVKEWAENSRAMELAHTKVYEGKRYILANYGQKPTGGYSIAIEDVDIADQDKVTVTIRFTEPDKNQNVTDALTYPQDIVYIENLDLPIEYRGIGDSEYVLTLVGCEELPKIQAQSQWIKIFSPVPNTSVAQTCAIEGVANVFEGSIAILLRDENGIPTDEQSAQAGMGAWHYFTTAIEVPPQLSDNFTLEIFSYSAKDSSIINLVQIPLSREKNGE